MQIKVLVTDSLEKEGVDILRDAGFQVDEVGKTAPEKLSEIIHSYDVLVVRSGSKATKEVIEKASNLKIIGRAGVGLDNIDVKTATNSGIIVMNAPEGNTISTAEHTVAMLMALSRNIAEASRSLKGGLWEKKKFLGTELHNKTIGVVGLGRIGRRVSAVAQSLGMKVIGYDPHVDNAKLNDTGIAAVNLKGILKQADFITFHLPLTEETRHMISDKEFELMKNGVSLINCSRGGIIDEHALYKNLCSGKVKGAALDVFEKEPPEGNPLLTLEQVVATPHLGASTKEAQVSVAKQLAHQIVDALLNKVVVNAVNLPSIDKETLEETRGYLSLGEKLGFFLNQIAAGEIKEITIKYSGDIINYDLTAVRASILVGLLKNSAKVNAVNAFLLLKEKRIKLKEYRETSDSEFTNLITVEVKNSKTSSISGTLIREGDERIVRIDGFSVEAHPEGHLLICYNDDKPGIMGHIGNILGEEGINIASMTLGRSKKGGTAITVLNLDQGVNTTIIKKIEGLATIHSVSLVRI